MAACAAEKAEERPRALMMAAPRSWTVLMNSPSSHGRSLITSGAGCPPIRALKKSGNWVFEWLPQMVMLVASRQGTPAFCASCALARFSSRRIMANQRSRGMAGALLMAMRQLVLQGLPTTRMRTSDAAFFSIARPWPTKILPLMPSNSLRSIPAFRGTLPTSRAQEIPSKPRSRSLVVSMPSSKGKAPSCSSMATPCKAAMPGSISISWRMTG